MTNKNFKIKQFDVLPSIRILWTTFDNKKLRQIHLSWFIFVKIINI